MMEETLRHNLFVTGRTFAIATGRSLSGVANLAVNEGKFFKAIEGGRTFTARTYDLMMNWLASNWPDGVDWPEGVPRPPRDPLLVNELARAPSRAARKRLQDSRTAAPRRGGAKAAPRRVKKGPTS